MRIALDPALLDDQPVQAGFAAAAQAGYDCVEIGNRDDFIPSFGAVAAVPDDLRAARRAADGAGVEIVSVAVIQAWSAADEERRAQAVAWWADGIRAAAELGAVRINSELSGDPNTPGACRAAFLRSMSSLLPILESEDIVVSIEPHPWDFLETTDSALDLVREVGSARVRYLHCLPHSYYLGGTITDQIEHARGWCDHIHLADTFRPERTIVNPPGLDHRTHQHFDIGQGEIDWTEAAGALGAVGFDGIATIQVFGWQDRAKGSFHANRAAAAKLFESSVVERGQGY
jgi:myo-inositol catabolism protein IolH